VACLDPEGREEMLRLVRDIGDITDAHIIMCSHLLQDVEYCCDAVTVINQGRVLLNGMIADLKKEDLRTYDIRVEGDREAFLGKLASLGWDCDESEEGVIRVSLPEGEGTRSLFQIASDLGVQLRHFHYKRDSLEEIFVNTLREAEA